MMDLNSSSSLDDCPPIDFDESDPNISLNYLEDYLDTLVNQLESELSYLPTTNSNNNNSNFNNNNGDADQLNRQNNNINRFSVNKSNNNLSSPNHSVNSSQDEADNLSHYSTINHANNPHDGDTINNYLTSSTSSLTKFNQRGSPLSFSNYSRSSFYENNDEISYNLLTATQIQRIIDFYKPHLRSDENPETKWDKKSKKTNGSSLPCHHLFGSDINSIERTTGGLTLPPFIENALLYLARYGINSVGIFRKSGVKSRIMALRQKLEAMTGFKREPSNNNKNKSDSTNGHHHSNHQSHQPTINPVTPTASPNLRLNYAPGEDFCVYDVADMVKMWLREIKPRPLITKEVITAYKEMSSSPSSTSSSSSRGSPSPTDLSLKLTVLLTDSQRAILEIFLHFLSMFAANSDINQMNSQNLAICFTPSLCECDSLTGIISAVSGGHCGVGGGLNGTVPLSQPENLANGFPRQNADTEIIFDAQRCLQYLIDNCSCISMVSVSVLPFPITSILSGNTGSGFPGRPPITTVINGAANLVSQSSTHPSSASPSFQQSPTSHPPLNGTNNGYSRSPATSNSNLINGGNLLPPTYESSIIINAAPCDILKRILYQRNLFDPTIVEWRIIKQTPSENSDVFEFKVQSSFFLPLKTFTIERKWTFIDSQPVVEPPSARSFCSSLKKPKTKTFKGIVLRETGYLYDSWWRIGTYGEGKCQLEISIATDLRGHSFYWYTNTFPAIIDWQLYQIKQSFLVDFIETKNYKSTTV